MAQVQLPFTLSSHPAFLPVEHDPDHPKPTSHHPPCFSTYPVLRLSPSQRTSKQPSQVIVTVPGQGWSIHKVSDQTILSSQKVSPSLLFAAPSVALSIPQSQRADLNSQPATKLSTKKNRKTRTRYVYAPVASCPSDPSLAVNQGRTIWVWTENEVNGGFGERDASNPDDSKSCSANIIKEFPSRVEMVYPLPSTHPRNSPAAQAARVLVLLQSGEALLCNEDLTAIATCRVHSNPPPSIPSEGPYVRVQAHNQDHEADSTSNLTGHPDISIGNSVGLLIYISRLKPQFSSSPQQPPNESTPKSKKRKSAATPSSRPTPAGFTHYSHLEICVLELQSDKLLALGRTSNKQDFLDVAIGAPGWVTIMGQNHTLSTYTISHFPGPVLEEETLPSRDLTLIPHPQCSALQLTTKSQSVGTSPASQASAPVLLALPCSVPLVFVFMSHSTQCLGLVVDLYHQAVLFVIQCPWPSAPKHSQPSLADHGPLTVSASLSSFSQPPHVYLCLSYQSIRIVQVLQAPEFPPDAPTWVEVLNPVVTEATLSWIIPQSNDASAHAKAPVDGQKKPVLSEQLLACRALSFSPNACPKEIPHLPSLRSFISCFNDVCLGNTRKTGHWDAESSKAAETAWAECVLSPLIGKDAGETQDVNMAGDDSSDHAMDQLATSFLRGPNSASKLASILSKAFVHVLLEMCLGQFAAAVGKELTANSADESALSSGNKPDTLKPYPAQIILCLLNSGLVEQSMVPGGVVAALRRIGDLTAVEAAISRLYDVDEFESVETIRWAIQFHSPQLPVPSSKRRKNHKLSVLERLLSKIISQPLSPGPLKKALKQILSTDEVLIIFRILNEWIDWWMQEGMAILRIHCETKPSLGSKAKPADKSSGSTDAEQPPENLKKSHQEPEAHWSGLPDLARIIEFIECSLDAHLIGLIQYKEANRILEALKLKLKREIEIDTVLQGLSGPLTQSTKLIKQTQRRQREKLQKSAKQSASTEQKPKPSRTPSKTLNHRTHTAHLNGRAAAPKRPSKKTKAKRPVHPDARRLQGEISNAQSVAEYALERFNL